MFKVSMEKTGKSITQNSRTRARARVCVRARVRARASLCVCVSLLSRKLFIMAFSLFKQNPTVPLHKFWYTNSSYSMHSREGTWHWNSILLWYDTVSLDNRIVTFAVLQCPTFPWSGKSLNITNFHSGHIVLNIKVQTHLFIYTVGSESRCALIKA